MLSQNLLMLALSAFLSGGALHGVVVQKIFKPLPLSYSLGIDGIYRLEVRDGSNRVHRQMVPREIFSLYEIGDEFDDRATPEQIRRRNQALRARAEQAARLAERAAKAKLSASDERVAQLFLRPDMLPETEGF
jgi:hypothetical protein